MIAKGDAMFKESIAEVVKAIRAKYGLSQRSFATLLGIGEATMVRYEQGAVPSRANANLILAAEDPHFMKGCIERNGSLLSERQRSRAEEYIYAVVSLDDTVEEGGNKMDEAYELTLRQEVLGERCANLIGEIIRLQMSDVAHGGKGNLFQGLCAQLSRLKPTIADSSNRDWAKLERIAGYLDCAEGMLSYRDVEVA